jgi:hypothetical protein
VLPFYSQAESRNGETDADKRQENNSGCGRRGQRLQHDPGGQHRSRHLRYFPITKATKGCGLY